MKKFFKDTNKASAWSPYPTRHPLGCSITSKSTTKHDAVSPGGVTCYRGNQAWKLHCPTYYHFQWPIWRLMLPVVETWDSNFTFPQMERNFDPGWILPRVSLILDFSGLDNEIWDFWSGRTDQIWDLSWCYSHLRIWGWGGGRALGLGDHILHIRWAGIFGSLKQTVVDWIVSSPQKMSRFSTSALQDNYCSILDHCSWG